MKTKRNKSNKRTMSIYTSVFKFREPYQVLFDADFTITAITQKMQVKNRLEAVLGATIKPMITQCTISHLVKLATEGSQVAQEAVNLSRNLCERRKCNHWKIKQSSIECIKGIIGDKENPLRYIICTQDSIFRSYLRENIIGVPIIYINKSGALILEQEGSATELKRKQLQENKLHAPPEELEQLNSVINQLESNVPIELIQRPSSSNLNQINQVIESSTSLKNIKLDSKKKLENKLIKNKQIKNKKKKGGPNPLSVKKKKKSTISIKNKQKLN